MALHMPAQMKVVFLDVDGVLNASRRVVEGTKGFQLKDWVIPKAVEHLNRITDATDGKLVISSTWRIGKTISELRVMFAEVGCHAPVIGKTAHGPCSWHAKAGYPECSVAHRGFEIQEWLDNCPEQVESFVILDDDSDLEPNLDHWVHTDLYRGLTRRNVEKAIRILGRNKTP